MNEFVKHLGIGIWKHFSVRVKRTVFSDQGGMLKHDFIIGLKRKVFEAFQHSLLDIELILPEMSKIAMMH